MKKDLTGEWLFRSSDQETFLPAVVPGCQYLDLMKNGVIPDPYVGTNERAVSWVHDKDFVYKKTFSLSKTELSAEYAELVLTKADTVAEIALNGRVVGRTENCHRKYAFPVKEYLVPDENDLVVTFFSPKKYVEKRYRETPTPINANGQNGIVHIRKPQFHFGWDWGPHLIPVGLGGEVSLYLGEKNRLQEPIIRVKKTEKGAFSVAVFAENAERILLTDPNGKVEEKSGQETTFLVENPQLWQTKELSGKTEQPLYTVTAIKIEERYEKKVGLRVIELRRDEDEFGYNFQFFLNGAPLFIKGANYIPSDCFLTRFDEIRRKKLLDAVLYSNMNMLRVWGGGYYADDELLDACDRLGILVWQDFPFACQAYPFFDPAFLNNVLSEVEYNVKRISSHPCLAVWCGNNEIEAMHLSWAAMKKYVDWTEKFFYRILPDAISRYDEITPYTPGSPVGSAHNRHVDADFVGDTHLWGVWHGLQPMTHYRKRFTRFCSEFGFESLPSFYTIRSYAEEKDYPLSSDVQRSHQKCAGGNDKMLKYVATRFPLSEDIRDLVYLSQITQATCISDAVEHWRRNKGRCNGAMYWQLNDCWPTCSWSSYDYYGGYKALLYAGKDFFAPLSLSLEDEKKEVKIVLVNDLPTPQTVDVEWIKFGFSGEKEEKTRMTLSVPPFWNKVVDTVRTDDMDAEKEGLAVRLYVENVRVQQKVLLLRKEKDLLLPKDEIQTRIEEEDGRQKITLFSPVYQRLVMLEKEDGGTFSENFFDLLPGETKTVYALDPAPISVRTVTTIKPAGKLKTFFAKIKVYFSARNLANMIYHAKVPKPLKT